MIPFSKPMKLNVDFSDIRESGIFTNGKYCRFLESRIEDIYKCVCYTCSSGTQGLLLAIGLLVGNSKISLPAFNWHSDKYILDLMNMKYSFCDIDRKTWLADRFHIFPFLVHTFGSFHDGGGQYAIYDGTHCLGTKLPELGLATVISMAPTKIVTAGEGGLILLKGPNNKLEEYRDKCSRMSEFHAKIGLNYLNYLGKFLDWKKKVYDFYKSNLNGQFQEIPYDSNYNTIGMLTDLKIPEEIEVKKYYEPLKKGLPNTDFVYSKIICLPSWFGCPYEEIVELIENENK